MEKNLRELKGLSRYKVDIERGEIFDFKRQIWLNPKANKRGYKYVNIQKDDGSRLIASVQSIVMAAYLKKEVNEWVSDGYVVDHINGNNSIKNKSDNRISNLRLISPSANNEGRIGKRKVFSEYELGELYEDFDIILDGCQHGIKQEMYDLVAFMHNCSAHTVQVKYLQYQKA